MIEPHFFGPSLLQNNKKPTEKHPYYNSCRGIIKKTSKLFLILYDSCGRSIQKPLFKPTLRGPKWKPCEPNSSPPANQRLQQGQIGSGKVNLKISTDLFKCKKPAYKTRQFLMSDSMVPLQSSFSFGTYSFVLAKKAPKPISLNDFAKLLWKGKLVLNTLEGWSCFARTAALLKKSQRHSVINIPTSAKSYNASQ